MNADSLITFILEQTAKKSWTSETVLRVGVDVAMKVNQIKELKGAEKKKLVVEVIQKAMHKCEDAEKAGKTEIAEITEKWAALQKIANDVLPVSLDLVVSAARGTFDFKKISPRTWVEYLCCCVTAATGVLAAENVIPKNVAASVDAAAKVAEQKMIVMVDLSGAREVVVLTDLSGAPVDLSGVKVSLPSEHVEDWAAAAAAVAVASDETAPILESPAVPEPVDDKKEDTLQL
jgi:hypothetical protein